MTETMQEKAHRNMLSNELRDNAMVSQSHQHYLSIVRRHLETVYAERADWNKCLDGYYTEC